jgi:hypothetical protein
MTHTELRNTLKEYRELGYTLQIKLNATTEKLQAEYDRIQANPEICELTSAVRLPLVLNELPELETECVLICEVNLPEIENESFGVNDLHPDDFQLQTQQYCEMVGADIEDFESVEDAREFLDVFSPWTREGEPVRETFHTSPLPFGIIAIALLLAFAEIFKKAVDKAIDSMTFSELAQFFIELRKPIFTKSQLIN